MRDAEVFYTYETLLGPASLAYADRADHHNPYVSPVYGDFEPGFPPTLIQGGTKEVLLSGFIRLYQALDQAGQTVKLGIYEGMPHVFLPILPESPESQAAMAKVRNWYPRTCSTIEMIPCEFQTRKCPIGGSYIQGFLQI